MLRHANTDTFLDAGMSKAFKNKRTSTASSLPPMPLMTPSSQFYKDAVKHSRIQHFHCPWRLSSHGAYNTGKHTGLSWDVANGPATSSTMRQACLKDQDSGLEPLVISVERN
jgi:hypothetical protein